MTWQKRLTKRVRWGIDEGIEPAAGQLNRWFPELIVSVQETTQRYRGAGIRTILHRTFFTVKLAEIGGSSVTSMHEVLSDAVEAVLIEMDKREATP